MSSGGIKPGAPSKPGQGSFPVGAPSSQAILLEKLNRRSTPDSEALASSDDEPDAHRQENPPPSTQPPRPVRRASWLNDTSQQPVPRQRKGSFASSSMSPTASHPSTPAAEPGVAAWGSHSASAAVLSRAHSGGGSFPWGTAIWNTERKEPPSRLTEVLPSPTSAVPPGGSGGSFFSAEGGLTQTSPAPREPPNSQIPFAIPLYPTPKTYRSQSYSVGQLEPETAATSMTSSAVMGARGRPVPHPGLQHRPSRPSMLSEMSNDGMMLGKVNEDEDDDSTGSIQGSQHQEQAKTIEMLTRENMMLRQQQYNARLRPRASTASAFGLGSGYLQEAVPEESDFAIDEHDEANDGSDLAARRSLARRMSEYGVGPFKTPYMVENRKLENVKKAHWQSSLGFGGLGDIPQSRRHSFADVPTRQASISSIGEAVQAHEPAAQEATHPQDYPTAYHDNSNYGMTNQVAPYFTGGAGLAGHQQALAQAAYANHYPGPYAGIPTTYSNRPTSPHRNMYGMSQPRHNQSLHIVLFKCARADVFYIQEGTGLTVKPGDLVIVEADRGTDLGTVARDNVDWQTAKELKEHYAEEQYRWLMMYSQNAAAAQEGSGAGLMAAANGLQGSAVGGMGPPSQHHMQEPNAGELKPKLIKRLAQSHEIHALRDKEGNEAKAKRVCQQKVKEHGLNMEILDAEFQMDWKKLTFYYFADTYINFNSLVTDLFKIYKTRIWMSAINPASFASPTLGLQAPSGVGPGAVVNRGSAARRQEAQQDSQSNYSGSSQAGRGAQSTFQAGSTYPGLSYPYNPYGAFGSAARAGGMPYTPGTVQGLDSFAGGFQQGGDYAGRGRFPSPQSPAITQHDQAVPALGAQPDLFASFQGLSLNSR
ncbi:PSP1 C-terminal domain-containing protein [Madurella fahalii]|uniref:PSP1 C-terminal domain-containing protein n=1 Tax=Madurella fahalii TaxID=1157608 RepID=A0ABQ0G639_9PEZI